jgi:hypothetical protein
MTNRIDFPSSPSFSIDNSSLNKIVYSEATIDKFFGLVDTNNIELNIPSESLMELGGGDWVHDEEKKQGAAFRLGRLVNFAERFFGEGKIILNETPTNIIQYELDNSSVRHVAVKSVRKGSEIALFDKSRHQQIHSTIQEGRQFRELSKSKILDQDRGAKKSGVLSNGVAEERLRKFLSTQQLPEWRDFLHSQFSRWIFGENLPFETFNKILEEKKCEVVVAFVNLLLVHHLAVFLEEDKCSEELKSLIEEDKNSRNDSLIAATAAYCDYFIAEDAVLRARCNFLNDLGLIRFRSIKLEDFEHICENQKSLLTRER